MVGKKKGFTLIELVAVMAIMTIIFSLGVSYIGLFRRVQESSSEKLLVLKIEDLLRYSKEYFLINGSDGKVRFDRELNTITATDNSVNILDIKYDDEFDVYFQRGTYIGELRISSRGIIDSGTIMIYKKGKRICKITIRVGVDYINVQWQE